MVKPTTLLTTGTMKRILNQPDRRISSFPIFGTSSRNMRHTGTKLALEAARITAGERNLSTPGVVTEAILKGLKRYGSLLSALIHLIWVKSAKKASSTRTRSLRQLPDFWGLIIRTGLHPESG